MFVSQPHQNLTRASAPVKLVMCFSIKVLSLISEQPLCTQVTIFLVDFCLLEVVSIAPLTPPIDMSQVEQTQFFQCHSRKIGVDTGIPILLQWDARSQCSLLF